MQIVRQDPGQRPSSAVRSVGEQDDTDEPRWSDKQVALFIEMAYAGGYHRRRLGLPDVDSNGFKDRCRRRLAWLHGCQPEASRANIWAGIDDEEPVDLDWYRDLPYELRSLRQPRGGAA